MYSGPIRKKKNIFERIKDNRRKKIIVSGGNKDFVVGHYKAKNEENVAKNLADMCDAFLKVGMTAEEFRNKIDTLAEGTIKGKFGYGQERKEILGPLYTEVQKVVNDKLIYNNYRKKIRRNKREHNKSINKEIW